MSQTEKSTNPTDQKIHWHNVWILLVTFVLGIFTGILTQFADRCPFLNPQIQSTINTMAEQERSLRQLSREQSDYLQKVVNWKKSYTDKILAELTPEQKSLWEARRMERSQFLATSEPPVISDEISQAPPRLKNDRMARTFSSIVAYQSSVDRLSQSLKLNDKQKAAIGKILQQRRDDFLKFLDQNPPPTRASQKLSQKDAAGFDPILDLESDEDI